MSEISPNLSATNITSKQKSDMTKVAIKNENILLADYFFIELWLEGAAREGAKPQKKYCRPASPVCKPVALKATGNQSNESNYSETGRTASPFE